MGNKVTTLYDFTLTANGSQQIQADANFYKILTASGDVSITRDGGSTVKPMRAGRGERNVQFLTLTIRDLSGAPNSGTILVGDSDFIDDTIVLSSALNVRPEAPTGAYKANGVLAANTPDTVFTPGANTGGAFVLNAGFWVSQSPVVAYAAFLAKAGVPPTTQIDGDLVLNSSFYFINGTTNIEAGTLPKDIFIPAGQGLYFIATGGVLANSTRHCQYKLL